MKYLKNISTPKGPLWVRFPQWTVYWNLNPFGLDIDRRFMFFPYFSRGAAIFNFKFWLDIKIKKVKNRKCKNKKDWIWTPVSNLYNRWIPFVSYNNQALYYRASCIGSCNVDVWNCKKSYNYLLPFWIHFQNGILFYITLIVSKKQKTIQRRNYRMEHMPVRKIA